MWCPVWLFVVLKIPHHDGRRQKHKKNSTLAGQGGPVSNEEVGNVFRVDITELEEPYPDDYNETVIDLEPEKDARGTPNNIVHLQKRRKMKLLRILVT